MKKILFLSLIITVSVVVADGTITWTGLGTDNLWTNIDNWDTEPNNPDVVLIDATGNDPYINMVIPDVHGDIRMGVIKTEPVSLTMSNGYLQSNGIRMGWFTGHGGTTLNVSGGEIVNSWLLDIGNKAGGISTFNLSDTGYIETERLYIAGNGNGIFNMSGGSIYVDLFLRVGGGNGTATWNMDGGLLEAGTYVCFGYGTSAGTNLLNMTGGEIRTGEFLIGRYADGIVNLSGGTIKANYYDTLPAKLLKFNTNGGHGILNLCGGEFIWMNEDFTTQTNGFIDAGNIVAYDGTGRVLCYTEGYDTIIRADDTAHHPVPENSNLAVNPRTDELQWQLPFPGQTVYCDVYLATDEMMTSATKIVDYQNAISAPIAVSPETSYYWRVDTYDPVTSEKTEGVVWNFTTNTVGAQTPIIPEDGAIDILKSQILSWDMFGEFDSVDIYIGADSPDNMALVASQSASITDFHYDGLEYGKTYYWRIDSVGDEYIQEGAVWNFTTITPNCLIEINTGDLNNDCKVDIEDLAILASNWLTCGWDVAEACE